jgi:hypothetical protein
MALDRQGGSGRRRIPRWNLPPGTWALDVPLSGDRPRREQLPPDQGLVTRPTLERCRPVDPGAPRADPSSRDAAGSLLNLHSSTSLQNAAIPAEKSSFALCAVRNLPVLEGFRPF